jgi:hypothetical protein
MTEYLPWCNVFMFGLSALFWSGNGGVNILLKIAMLGMAVGNIGLAII